MRQISFNLALCHAYQKQLMICYSIHDVSELGLSGGAGGGSPAPPDNPRIFLHLTKNNKKINQTLYAH